MQKVGEHAQTIDGTSIENRARKRPVFEHRSFIDFSTILGDLGGGFGRLLAIQNGSLKGKIYFFNKNAILDGF